MAADIEQIVSSIDTSIAEHDPRLDSFLYNGGTALGLVASIGATSFVWTDSLGWLPRLLAGIAALVIGLERALGFGQRWRTHRSLKVRYESLKLRFRSLPDDAPDRDARLTKLLDELDALRKVDEIPVGEGPGSP